MARSSVPKFGNWENEDNVPYTVYFDKARKNRGGPMVNPNDPQESPDMFPKTRPDEPIGLQPKTPEQVPARYTRPSGGSDQSFERSPLHPHYQGKVTGRAAGSPASEGRNYDSSHGNPVRSRLRPARGVESPNKSPTVPKFGEWNENDPQSAENFTRIFTRLSNERNTGGTGNPSGTPKHPSHYNTRSQSSDGPPYKKCCFPWW